MQRWLEEDPPWTQQWASTLPPEDQNFIRDVLPRVLKQAASEWKAEQSFPLQDLGAGRMPCSLCNTQNRWIYYLVNQVNGNRMNVGGDCVKHFAIDVSVSGKTKAQVIREAAVLWRESLLDKEFPGIHTLVRGWVEHLERYEIIIPASLETPYLSLGQEVRRIYSRFVECQKADEAQRQRDAASINELRELLQKRRELTTRITEHVKANLGKRFAAHQYYVSWIQRHDANPATTISWLKEDGQITPRTLFRLAEPRLMKAITRDINHVIEPTGYRVEQVVPDRRGYILAPKKQRALRVRLFAKHSDFLLRYGEAVLGEPTSTNLEELLDLTTVLDMKSAFEVWGEFVPLLGRHGLSVAEMTMWRPDFDLYFPEIVIREQKSGKYILLGNLEGLVNEFKTLAFKVGTRTHAQLAKAISDPTLSRYSREDILVMYDERKERVKAHG